MIKSLLVAVDGSKASEVAQVLSVEIAGRLQARIGGLGVLDTPWITAPQAVPLGASYYKAHRDQEVLKRITEKVEALLGDFERRCRAAGVDFSLAEAQGSPAELIEVESEAHDLIVVGKDTSFHFRPDGKTSDTVVRLARDDPRPILVTSERPPGEGAILVAYDGSLPASRAMHMFALLGLGAGRQVEVLTVDRDRDRATALAGRGAKIFATHGIEAASIGLGAREHPAELILERAARARMLVMGAFGRRELRDYFFGSCTTRVLEACPAPLFIHH